MARGKLKYKDVVGKRNGQAKNFKHQKKKFKPRKTFSLHKNDKSNKHKRKFYDNGPNEVEIKKQKVEEPVLESSSDNESDTENDMTKLLGTFGSNLNNKNSLAIESSESDTDEDDEINNEGEQENDTESHLDAETSGSENEHFELDEEEEDIPDYSNDEEDVEKLEEKELDDEDSEKKSDIEDEDEIDLEIQEEEDDNENSKDPFTKHVCFELHDSLLESVQNLPMSVNNYNKFWSKLGKIFLQIPKCGEIHNEKNNEFTISEKKTYAPPGEIPKQIDIKATKQQDLYIKTQICKNLCKANKGNLLNSEDIFTPLQGEIFSIINNYQDLYYPERTIQNAEEIRYVYCLHAVNHVLKTRLKVIHHNARLSKKDDVPEQFRDQGLVRPKVKKNSFEKEIRIILFRFTLFSILFFRFSLSFLLKMQLTG